MSVKIIIPTPLRQYTAKNDTVMVEGATVQQAFESLAAQYGDLRKQLFTDEGKLRSFVNIYKNDEDIRYLAKEQTPVKDHDVLTIIPSIAGGAPRPRLASACCR